MAANTLEELLRHFGDPGRCQLILWLLILYNLFHVGMIQQFNIMISYRPEHRCKMPATDSSPATYLASNGNSFPPQDLFGTNETLNRDFVSNGSSVLSNQSSLLRHLDFHGNESAVLNNHPFLLRPTGKEGKCFLYADPRNPAAGQLPCSNGWEYDTAYGEIYPVNEFELVCDNAYLLSLALSLTFVGVMIGGVVFGPISDYFGRRVTMSMLTTVLSMFSISIYFCPNYASFVVVRVLLGIFNQGLQTVCLTYVSELFLPRMRTLTNAAIGIMWALMLPVFAGLFYGLGNWRHVHLLMGLASLISAMYVWFLPEPVVWLLNKDKVTEAASVLKRIAYFNKILPPVTLVDDLNQIAQTLKKKAAENAKKSNILDLVHSSVMRKITMSLLYMWFTVACVAFGLSFSIAKLSGSIYVNYTITGFMEVGLRITVLWFFMRYGRIKIISPLLLTCGILTIGGCLLENYVEPSSGYNKEMLVTALALFARNVIAVNFTLTIIFTSEVFPTVLRSTGIGLGFTAARLGNIVTPIIYFRIAEIWAPAPQIIYGVMALAAGLIVLMLPETFNRPMPNSVQDVEDMMSKKRRQQKINTVYNSPELFTELRVVKETPVDENSDIDERREPNIIYKSVKELAGSLNK